MAFEENEMLVTMKDVAERLNDLGIKYMVTGSFAMSAYAKARTTMDIDVVLEISSTDAKRFERRFVGDYYVDELSIVNADRHQSMPPDWIGSRHTGVCQPGQLCCRT